MSRQVFTEHPLRETPAIQSWVALLRSHRALTRQFSNDLLNEHALTLNDYEVLLYLAREPERRLRRVDLADRVLLTPSGITRLLDGLERAGYVARATCDSDARVTYAVLTEKGLAKLREAAPTHLASICDAFGAVLSPEELETLAELLGRLSNGGRTEACAPESAAGAVSR